MPFILFDTETTGSGEVDRICQIALGVLKKEGCDYHIDYCKPPLAIGYGAMAVHGISEEEVKQGVMLQSQPTKKFVTVDEVAAVAVFLCSDGAASITGSTLPVEGGWVAQ